MDDIREKIGELSAKTKAAHARIDSIEENIREDLKEINAELKVLVQNMNYSKGFSAALVFLSGAVGAGLMAFLEFMLKKT